MLASVWCGPCLPVNTVFSCPRRARRNQHLSPGSLCSECGIGSGPAFPLPHKSCLFPLIRGFSLTLYIKLVFFPFFFFFLAFCFLNKPKSKTNPVCSIALPLTPCLGLILHSSPHPQPSLCWWRCLLQRVVGGGQLWAPWPVGQERGCYGWLGQPRPDRPPTQQGGSLTQRETWGGPSLYS